MKKIYSINLFLLIFVFAFSQIQAQIITTDPTFPTENDEVTITFHADQGTKGLMGFTGDVYAHTGVNTNVANWRYAPSWGDNSAKYKLTRIATDTYTLVLTPSIREYYGIADGETPTKLTFVFRSADKSREGKDVGGTDIFYDIYKPTLNLSILKPTTDNQIVALNTTIDIEAETSLAANINVYIDENLLEGVDNATSITTSYQTIASGSHEIKVTASDGNSNLEESINFYTEPAVTEETRPTGLVKGINYDKNDNTKATLVLFAPEKEYVFAVGDFNDWKLNENYLMKKDGDYFWLEISGLSPNTEYAFQYWIDGEIQVADPYTEKTVDENDKWINENYTIYPNLKEYPTGKTTGVCSVIETNRAEYNWTVTDFKRPDINKMVIYELHFRDFTEEGSVNAAFAKLDYLQNLGINVIELMPFSEFEGNDSWGYNPSFYFAPDKAYGTREDYKAFIDECHSRGIAVVQDMVLNHSYDQSPFYKMYKAADGKPAANNPWYNQTAPNTSYSWGHDFNHESINTQELVDSVSNFWLTQYKVDGFRFDFTKGFTNTTGDGWAYDQSRINILERMANNIWAFDPTDRPYVILEHLTDNSEEKVLANYGMLLWGNMSGAYGENAMGWYGENNKSSIVSASYTSRNWTYPNLITYMESHDEERLMYKNITYGNVSGSQNTKDTNTALSRMETVAAMFIPIPGPKMIWQFGELGYDYSINYNGNTNQIDYDWGRISRKPVKWDYFDDNYRKRLYQVYSALNKLKTSEVAFTTDNIDMSHAGDWAQKAIILRHSDMDVVIVANIDVVSKLVNPYFTKTGTWYDYFSGESITVDDVNANLTLQPGEYHIYTTKQLAKPDIIDPNVTGIETNFSSTTSVYPNPAKEFIYVNSEKQINKIEVYSLVGQKVIEKTDLNKSTNQINVTKLDKGVYILNIYSDDHKKSQKIIIE